MRFYTHKFWLIAMNIHKMGAIGSCVSCTLCPWVVTVLLMLMLRAYVTSTANIQQHQFKRKIHFSDSIKRTSRSMMMPYLPWKVQIEKLSFSSTRFDSHIQSTTCTFAMSMPIFVVVAVDISIATNESNFSFHHSIVCKCRRGSRFETRKWDKIKGKEKSHHPLNMKTIPNMRFNL